VTYQAWLGGRQQERNKPVSVHLWEKQFVKELEDKWQQHLQCDLAGATHSYGVVVSSVITILPFRTI
jgi:hypothetical protein